ncbi:PssD/Cps14F family polysaccharide biosynthesis glycosyltransferase [Bifidobacterium sp. UTBIF-78]|uniref:PssD/Cps14F family polysaccharide biosynthesis glycosyltransferase n=1 Tax=Bifidobacterium sp. UTBIF-78 TaxID=1465263 RepID=UPI00112DD00E|nr:PssD/Cps14F family polysaccharide biosynthesis glycosyltransferase [Bifidobacterium sp. UTBIF-78]TPF95434.1 hypothetical protein BG22_01925 [Bifidobacterium sp. UTBIF-78]
MSAASRGGKRRRLCLVASSGGHIEELMQLGVLRERYDYFLMTPRTKWTEHLEGHKHFIHDIDRSTKLTKLVTLAGIFLEQIPVFLKERPTVVVTTGAVVALPICLYVKLFGGKVIFIESIARVHTTSQTGRILSRFADLFLVQWEEQLRCYPNARYAGWVY